MTSPNLIASIPFCTSVSRRLRQTLPLVVCMFAPIVGCSDPCVDDGVSRGACEDGDGDVLPGDTASTTGIDDTSSDTETSGTSPDSARLCLDADRDGFGDPNTCENVAGGIRPGWVTDDTDCDDQSLVTFPGAAEHEPVDPLACRKDADYDGFGDEHVGPPVTPGTDCDDENPFAFPGAAEQEASLCAEDKDDDGWGDEEPSNDEIDPGLDCDDNDPSNVPTDPDGHDCLDPLSVSAGPDQNIDIGNTTQLIATTLGGSGRYAYQWSPVETLTSPQAAETTAAPTKMTQYVVEVVDSVTGESASDDVNVYLVEHPIDLRECEIVDLGTINDALVPPDWQFSPEGDVACQKRNNNSSAIVCDTIGEQYVFRGHFGVDHAPGGPDDDWVGFMWGVQENASAYYLFSWKRGEQVHDFCGDVHYSKGMRIKVVHAGDDVLSCEDIVGDFSTPNSKLLARPHEIPGGKAGWNVGEDYTFEVERSAGGFAITILDAAETVVAHKVLMDTTLTGGDVGVFDFSQDSACYGPISIEAIEE